MAVLTADDHNFDEIIQGEYVVVDIYGDHCGACVALAPIFEAASNDMPLIRFAHINIIRSPKLQSRYNIHMIPTLYFYRNGELIHSVVGSMDRKTLNGHIAKMLYE